MKGIKTIYAVFLIFLEFGMLKASVFTENEGAYFTPRESENQVAAAVQIEHVHLQMEEDDSSTPCSLITPSENSKNLDTAVIYIAPPSTSTERDHCKHDPFGLDINEYDSMANSSIDQRPLPGIAPLHPSQLNLYSSQPGRNISIKSPINSTTLFETMHNHRRVLPFEHSIMIQKDKETGKISEMAKVIPAPWICRFKEKMVLTAGAFGQVSDFCKYLSVALVAYCLNGIIENSSFINIALEKELIIMSVISYKMFDRISQLFKQIKIRDELRLESYERTRDFQKLREMNMGEGIYYSNDEITNYLKEKNEFKSLPGLWEHKFIYFGFNLLSFSESFVQILKVFATALTFGFIFSQVMEEDIFHFGSLTIYSTLTGSFLSALMALHIVEKKRIVLKCFFENRIENYFMAKSYFLLIEKIEKDKLHNEIRYLPEHLIKEDEVIIDDIPSQDDMTTVGILKGIGSSLLNAGKLSVKLVGHLVKQLEDVL